MSELQLTEQVIDRLNRMREEVLRADFEIESVYYKYDGETPLYFSICLPSGHTCAFVSKESEIEGAILKSIDATLSNPVKMQLFSNLSLGRYACVQTSDGESVSLDRDDYSTPAQRALESLGRRMSDAL